MKASELEKKFGKRKRKTIAELKQIAVVRPDQNPNFCLLLGAGASRSSGIRSASEMVEEWLRSVFKDIKGASEEASMDEIRSAFAQEEAEWYDREREYACLIERIYPLKANRRKFIETEVANKIPSIGYAYLVRIAEAGLIRTIFTTNFDDLLNEAFYQFSHDRPLVCAHDSSIDTISISSHRAKIIKLHGDYLFDDIKNTSVETERLGPNMRDKLCECLKEYGLILAGYSGSDRSITHPLREMLGNSTHLRNGLFWCFREGDQVSGEALEILRQQNAFFVLIPGFDELMAELYATSERDSSPFSAKLATDRASQIIDSYLKNPQLRTAKCEVIRKHLQQLEADKNATLLSDLLKDLNIQSLSDSGLTEKNLLVLLEIERAVKDRHPEGALARLAEELGKVADKRFKELLLRRRFQCCKQLNRFDEAKQAAQDLLDLEPANFFVSLNEVSLRENRAERLTSLERLTRAHPYSAVILNAYADEVTDAIEKGAKLGASVRSDTVLDTLQKSTEIDPSIGNPAWSQLFDYHSRQGAGVKVSEKLSEIVDIHLRQAPYDSRTTSMLLRFCQKFKCAEYKGGALFNHLQSAYDRHFPRDYVPHLYVMVNACIDFDLARNLRPVLEQARSVEELKEDPGFAGIMMDVYYDVFRDLSGAIDFGSEFLRRNRKTSVEIKLLKLHLAKGQHQKARELHSKLKGAIDLSRWMHLDSDIMECEGRFQDAIDTLEAIPDRRDFAERFTVVLSFLELRLGAPARAAKRCRLFLEERGFSSSLEAEIVNYEFAKTLDAKKVNKERVSGVLKVTESEMTKAVCHSLLDEDRACLDLVRQESEKRFSKIEDCLRWPVLSRHKSDLSVIRDGLIKRRRSLSEL